MSGYDGYADFSQSNKQDWSGYGQGNGQPQVSVSHHLRACPNLLYLKVFFVHKG